MRNKTSKTALTKEQEKNIINSFNDGHFNQNQLDALHELQICYSTKELALELCKTTFEAVDGNSFIKPEEKERLQKQLFNIKYLVQLIKEVEE